MEQNKSVKNQNPRLNKVLETRKHLETIVLNMSDYKVRTDPVVRALLKGLQRDDPQSVNNLTVATLRAAGCLDKEEDLVEKEVKSKPPVLKKDNNKKEVKVKTVKETVPKALRERDRIFLFFDSLGHLAEGVNDRLQDLRRDGNKLLKFMKLTNGDSVTVERKIKEINDFDLLYLLDGAVYDTVTATLNSKEVQLDAVHRIVTFFINKQFPPELPKLLKGPVAEYLESFPNHLTVEELPRAITAVWSLIKEQNWFKIGKSPSINRIAHGASRAAPK